VVLSNSLLHHLERPAALFQEMARVAKPEGLILLRDLRRPSRLAFPFHVRWHGRYYSGLMYRLFVNSVRAAYTPAELAGLLRESPLAEAQVFLHERTHLGFARDGRRSRRD
jgi:SAM-dependent methyltransferase